MEEVSLTEYEAQCLDDARFLRAKRSVVEKNMALLYRLQDPLQAWGASLSPALRSYVEQSREGKVSQGENYRQLPYQVFDYPRLFTPEATFALRTLIWWGQHFSVTLHVAGTAWEVVRSLLQPQVVGQPNLYIGVGDSPWEHHFGEDNFRPATALSEEAWRAVWQGDFFKMGRYWSLAERHRLPELVMDTVGEWQTWLAGD